MKITAEHVSHISSKIDIFLDLNNLTLDDVKAHYVERGMSMKRMRWDLLYAANLSNWLLRYIYSYADDSHIDTVLRKITVTD